MKFKAYRAPKAPVMVSRPSTHPPVMKAIASFARTGR